MPSNKISSPKPQLITALTSYSCKFAIKSADCIKSLNKYNFCFLITHHCLILRRTLRRSPEYNGVFKSCTSTTSLWSDLKDIMKNKWNLFQFYISHLYILYLLCMSKKFKIFMVPFYGRGSTVSRLQTHDKETVDFLTFSCQEFLVLNWSTLEGWKAESTLEPPSGFDPGTPGSGIQCLNH